MFEVLYFISGGYYSGAFGQMLAQWEQAGMFSYVLPFLLIFALVFGILSKINLFGKKGGDGTDNRALNGIIALVVGLLALQFEFVPMFFSEIFPRMGIALSVVLAIIIVAGLFIDPDNKGFMITLMATAIILAVVVVSKSFGATGWVYGGNWWALNNSWVIPLLVIIIAIVAVIVGSKPNSPTPKVESLLAKALRG